MHRYYDAPGLDLLSNVPSREGAVNLVWWDRGADCVGTIESAVMEDSTRIVVCQDVALLGGQTYVAMPYRAISERARSTPSSVK